MIQTVTSLKAPSVALQMPEDIHSNTEAYETFVQELGDVGIRDIDYMHGDDWSITHCGFHTVSGDYAVIFPGEYLVRLGESDEFHVFSEQRFFELFTVINGTAPQPSDWARWASKEDDYNGI